MLNMKKNNERVLAYSIAKVISLEELSSVSGSGSNITTRETFKTTGPHGGDISHDISCDGLA